MTEQRVAAGQSLRVLRIMFIAFLVHMVMVILLAEYLQKGPVRKLDEFYYGIAGIAVLEFLIAMFVRSKLDPTYDSLRLNPDDKSALAGRNRWHIILFAVSESVVLLGFALRFLGTPLTYCVPFYVAGVLLLLLCAPRKLD
ncbi:MAG TPA: hypothetical protein VM056_03690 [Terriglobales bacterium]|nr:hypothetical protein [Terriglobales bacterium]